MSWVLVWMMVSVSAAAAEQAPPAPPACARANHTAPRHTLLIEGDFLLGVIVTMREEGCTRVKASGLGTLQALRAALRAARGWAGAAWGVPGLLLADDCGDPARSLQLAAHFIHASKNTECGAARRVWGVIEAGASSIDTTSLLQLFQIPQISLEQLGRPRLRRLPGGASSAAALAAVARRLRCSAVSVLHDHSARGRQAFDALKMQLSSRNICIAARERIASNASSEELLIVVQRLQAQRGVQAVIVLADERVAAALAGAEAAVAGVPALLVGGAGWWARAATPALRGALALQPAAAPPPALRSMLRDLTPRDFPSNPWFTEYYEQQLQCGWSSRGGRACSPRAAVALEPHPRLQYVTDAVLAFTHAYRSLQESVCGDIGPCAALHAASGDDFLQYLWRVRFTGMSDNEFYFNDVGDSPAHYDVINYKEVAPGEFRWVKVGSYFEDNLDLNISALEHQEMSSCEQLLCAKGAQGELRGEEGGRGCCPPCIYCSQNETVQESSRVPHPAAPPPLQHVVQHVVQRVVRTEAVASTVASLAAVATLAALLILFLLGARWIMYGKTISDPNPVSFASVALGAAGAANTAPHTKQTELLLDAQKLTNDNWNLQKMYKTLTNKQDII